MGRRQAVRHRVLIPASLGSNPSAPANGRHLEVSFLTNRMLLFTGNANPALATELATELKMPLGDALVSHFSDGETRVEIQENVRGQDCFIIQSTSHPTNDHLMELLLIADALRRASASRITAVMPYFGYARQDKRLRSARVPISAKLVADLLHTVGIHRVLTMDLHSDQIQGFFSIPVDNVSGSKIFIQDILNKNYAKPLIISPDVGGVVRARAYAKQLHADLAIIDKRRPRPNEIQIMNIIGEVKDRICIIVDDMVDTAETLCLAAKALKENQAQKVIAYCTHPILSGSAIEHIAKSQLDELVVTNTIPLRETSQPDHRIRQLSIASLLAEIIRRMSDEESVSALFPT